MNVTYKKRKKLTITFDENDVGNKMWTFFCLIKMLKTLSWRELNLTDRDFGTIDRVYTALSEAGVDFNSEEEKLTNIGEQELIDGKKVLRELIEKIEENNKRLQKLEPKISIEYCKK